MTIDDDWVTAARASTGTARLPLQAQPQPRIHLHGSTQGVNDAAMDRWGGSLGLQKQFTTKR